MLSGRIFTRHAIISTIYYSKHTLVVVMAWYVQYPVLSHGMGAFLCVMLRNLQTISNWYGENKQMPMTQVKLWYQYIPTDAHHLQYE